MHRHLNFAAFIAAAGLLVAGAAFGDQGVSVNITNDGTQDIIVTVYDVNAGPGRKVLTNAHINGFTSVPVSLVGDANGQARVRWTATSTDGVSRTCGQSTDVVNNDGTVHVHADSTCEA
jgi:hypothetical protein